MAEKPEALRLADAIDPFTRKFIDHLTCKVAADELRRMHAVNQELLAALRLVTIDCNNFHHGHKDRHALGEDCPVAARISAAIAKAEEQK